MNQRGNAYFYLLGVILVMAAIGVAGWKGYSLGQTVVRAEWQQQALAESITNAAKYKELSDKYRAMEQTNAARIAAVSKTYQSKLQGATNAKLAAESALRDGTLRLRLTEPARCEASGDPAPTPSPGAERRDGSATGELLGPTDSAFLVALASEADSVAIQLAACQAVIRSDRQ